MLSPNQYVSSARLRCIRVISYDAESETEEQRWRETCRGGLGKHLHLPGHEGWGRGRNRDSQAGRELGLVSTNSSINVCVSFSGEEVVQVVEARSNLTVEMLEKGILQPYKFCRVSVDGPSKAASQSVSLFTGCMLSI